MLFIHLFVCKINHVKLNYRGKYWTQCCSEEPRLCGAELDDMRIKSTVAHHEKPFQGALGAFERRPPLTV